MLKSYTRLKSSQTLCTGLVRWTGTEVWKHSALSDVWTFRWICNYKKPCVLHDCWNDNSHATESQTQSAQPSPSQGQKIYEFRHHCSNNVFCDQRESNASGMGQSPCKWRSWHYAPWLEKLIMQRLILKAWRWEFDLSQSLHQPSGHYFAIHFTNRLST
jgi:hypothetical protein